jgi:tetratricopeptide (TPR) repeat protein
MEPDPLFDRLRDALEPDYRLEQWLASGGMGTVYLATDVTLNAPVAVKVLRPELASAHAAEAFMREGRVLARVRHPNVVTIHHASHRNGLHFYIMEYVEGDTLAQRLARGKLSVSDAVKMGRDLLDGLESVHRAGVVHRDVKPSNVFLVNNPLRAKLADFGIALAPAREPRKPHQRSQDSTAGTPGYMAPEQIAGDAVTSRTDLYLAGMVIYEALTGIRFPSFPEAPSWRKVGWLVARVLRRATRERPEERYADAQTVRRALWRTRTIRYLVRAAMLAIGGIIVGASAVVGIRAFEVLTARPGTLSVALPAFDYVGPPAQRAVADSIHQVLYEELGSHPDFPVTTPRWWWLSRPGLVIRGRVAVAASSVSVQLSDVRFLGSGAAITEVRAPLAAWAPLRDSLTYRVLLAAWDSLSPLKHWLPRAALPRSPTGLARFLEAERLAAAGKWQLAYDAYVDAERWDSTCWLCSWRLAEVERWLSHEPDSTRVRAYLAHIDSFPPWYQSLIRAGELPLPERLDTLGAAASRWRDFFLAHMELGDEMFHRGPLAGHARAEAIASFERAASYRPDFAPAWEHLAWVDIAEGDSAEAVHALVNLDRRNVRDDPFAVSLRALLGVAFAFRFLPESAAIGALEEALRDSVAAASPNLAAAPRMLGSFDAPNGEIAFGKILAARPTRDLQRSGLIAQVFGSLALGRPARAVALSQQLAAVSPERESAPFGAELQATIALLDPGAIVNPPMGSAATLSPQRDSVFARTIGRMLTARQKARTGDIEGARAELLWHEHTDVIGLPKGPPQTAEVDWAFGTLARWELAALLAPHGERAEACRAYRDVVRLWSEGEPLYRARADTARLRIRQLCQ